MEVKNKKYLQQIMIWFLPLIVFGGILWPVLGFLVFLMMIFFLILSYFKARFWCAYLCPRGAFLDMIISRVSRQKKPPMIFHRRWFRLLFFLVFIPFVIFQFGAETKDLKSFGFIFVRMCLITTFVAIILGIFIHQRSWCLFCPMGFLQENIHRLNKKRS